MTREANTQKSCDQRLMVDKEGELATLQQEPRSNGSVSIGTSFFKKKGETANQHPRLLQNDPCVRVVRVRHNARAAEEDKWASGGAGCSQGSLGGMGYTVQRKGLDDLTDHFALKKGSISSLFAIKNSWTRIWSNTAANNKEAIKLAVTKSQ
jgi:hypothetical protein